MSYCIFSLSSIPEEEINVQEKKMVIEAFQYNANDIILLGRVFTLSLIEELGIEDPGTGNYLYKVCLFLVKVSPEEYRKLWVGFFRRGDNIFVEKVSPKFIQEVLGRYVDRLKSRMRYLEDIVERIKMLNLALAV